MSKFTVNGKEYTGRELDFEFLLHLEKNDVPLSNISGMSAATAFFTYCTGMSEKAATKEITAHVISNNGEFPTELIEVYLKYLEESDFFLALSRKGQQSEEETATEEPAETPKKRTSKKA